MRPPGRFDLRLGTGADLHAAHRERAPDFTVGKQLRRSMPRPDQSCRHQRFRRHVVTDDLGQVVETDFLRILLERVGEPALRNAARDRHLAAFEMRLATTRTAMAGPRHRALVTPCRTSCPCPNQDHDRYACGCGAIRRWLQVVQSDFLDAFGACLIGHVLTPPPVSLTPGDVHA
jgi:hypothetical protein